MANIPSKSDRDQNSEPNPTFERAPEIDAVHNSVNSFRQRMGKFLRGTTLILAIGAAGLGIGGGVQRQAENQPTVPEKKVPETVKSKTFSEWQKEHPTSLKLKFSPEDKEMKIPARLTVRLVSKQNRQELLNLMQEFSQISDLKGSQLRLIIEDGDVTKLEESDIKAQEPGFSFVLQNKLGDELPLIALPVPATPQNDKKETGDKGQKEEPNHDTSTTLFEAAGLATAAAVASAVGSKITGKESTEGGPSPKELLLKKVKKELWPGKIRNQLLTLINQDIVTHCDFKDHKLESLIIASAEQSVDLKLFESLQKIEIQGNIKGHLDINGLQKLQSLHINGSVNGMIGLDSCVNLESLKIAQEWPVLSTLNLINLRELDAPQLKSVGGVEKCPHIQTLNTLEYGSLAEWKLHQKIKNKEVKAEQGIALLQLLKQTLIREDFDINTTGDVVSLTIIGTPPSAILEAFPFLERLAVENSGFDLDFQYCKKLKVLDAPLTQQANNIQLCPHLKILTLNSALSVDLSFFKELEEIKLLEDSTFGTHKFSKNTKLNFKEQNINRDALIYQKGGLFHRIPNIATSVSFNTSNLRATKVLMRGDKDLQAKIDQLPSWLQDDVIMNNAGRIPESYNIPIGAAYRYQRGHIIEFANGASFIVDTIVNNSEDDLSRVIITGTYRMLAQEYSEAVLGFAGFQDNQSAFHVYTDLYTKYHDLPDNVQDTGIFPTLLVKNIDTSQEEKDKFTAPNHIEINISLPEQAEVKKLFAPLYPFQISTTNDDGVLGEISNPKVKELLEKGQLTVIGDLHASAEKAWDTLVLTGLASIPKDKAMQFKELLEKLSLAATPPPVLVPDTWQSVDPFNASKLTQRVQDRCKQIPSNKAQEIQTLFDKNMVDFNAGNMAMKDIIDQLENIDPAAFKPQNYNELENACKKLEEVLTDDNMKNQIRSTIKAFKKTNTPIDQILKQFEGIPEIDQYNANYYREAAFYPYYPFETKQQRDEFTKIYQEIIALIPYMQWTGGTRKIIFDGDIIHDRGTSDILARIIETLRQSAKKQGYQESIITTASNHDDDLWLSVFPVEKKMGDIGQKNSYARTLQMGDPYLKQITATHFDNLQLMYYDTESNSCVFHGAVNREFTQEMKDILSFFLDTNADTLPELVQEANKWYREIQKKARDAIQDGTWKELIRDAEFIKNVRLIDKILWAAENYVEETFPFDDMNIRIVHGHAVNVTAPPNIKHNNLDQYLGKTGSRLQEEKKSYRKDARWQNRLLIRM